MLIIAVVNLKGGTSKTTSAAYLLHAFYESGLRTIGVDADGENESLASWQSMGEWPMPVVGMAVPNLHKQLPGVVGDRYDAVVIDTPPLKEQRGIVASALRIATHALVPVAPTGLEFARLPAVMEAVADVQPVRPDGQAPVLAALLTRASPTASATEVYRAQIADLGIPVLAGKVVNLQRFAQAYPNPITNALNTAYGDAVSELLDMEVPA